MNIIHLNTRQMPHVSAHTLEGLFQIAVAVDVYDLNGCLGLWPTAWCAAIEKSRAGEMKIFVGDLENMSQLAWIGWVFGQRKLFDRALGLMFVNVEVDGEGTLVDQEGNGLEEMEYLKAMNILDHLATCRTDLIAALLHVLEKAVQNGANKIAGVSAFCRCSKINLTHPETARNKARADCNNAILGSIIQALAAEDLFPFPTGPKDVFESASDLNKRLLRVVRSLETLGAPHGTAKGSNKTVWQVELHEMHKVCSQKEKLEWQLNDVMRQIKCRATPAHIKHLALAAREVGGGL